MNKDTNLSRRKYDFFYLKITTLEKGEVKEYPIIFEKGSTEVHPFTNYLSDKFLDFSLEGQSYNSIANFHLTYIKLFLNYIFNDSKTPIDSIDDLTIEMVKEFVDKYCKGSIAKKNNNNKPNKETVNDMNKAITYFVYWLCWKKNASKRKLYKMKFISTNDFEVYFRNVKTVSGTTKQVKALSPLVAANPTRNNNPRKKVMKAGKYTVERLIDVALRNDPMMAFGIVLGAYSGLRQGYITQLTDARLEGFDKGIRYNMKYDFNYEAMLRDDGKMTSHLKRRCYVPVYPGCSEVIYTYYQVHLDLLRSKGLYPNKYGALFIDERGFAMSGKTYLRRFKKLSEILEVVITQEANMGIGPAIREQQLLSEAHVTQHSLRHYFKGLIQRLEKDRAAVAYYLAQKSLESQDQYSPPQELTESIRRCMDEALSIKAKIQN